MNPIDFGDARLRLGGDIDAVAVSPDGRLVALGSGMGDETSIWKLPDCVQVARCGEASRSLAFSPDGAVVWLAYAGVHRWDFGAEAPTEFRSSNPFGGEIGAPIALSPDGRVLAAGRKHAERREVVILDASNGRELGAVGHDAEYLDALSFSHDGRFLAFGGGTAAVVIDVSRPRSVYRRHEPPSPGRSVVAAYSPVEDLLAVATAGSVQIAFIVGDAPARVVELPFELESFGFTADGANLWVRRYWTGSIALVDVGRGAVSVDEIAPGGVRSFVAARPDGGLIATSFQHARVIERGASRPVAALPGHACAVTSIALSPDGALLATAGGHDRTVHLWHSDTGLQLHTLGGHGSIVPCVSFSFDGALLATACADGTLRIFEVATGSLRVAVERAHGSANLSAVAFDPTGRWLATLCEEGAVVLRDPTTGSALRRLTRRAREEGFFSQGALAWSADGELLASLGGRHEVVVHDVATGAEIFAAPAMATSALAFAKHTRWLAYGGVEVAVHDFTTDLGLRVYGQPCVTALAFDPQGRLACAHRSEPLRIVNPLRHVPPIVLGAEDLATAVEFAPDGTLVFGRTNGVSTRCDVPGAPRSALESAKPVEGPVSERRRLARERLSHLGRQQGSTGYRDAPAARLDDDGTSLQFPRPPHDVGVRLRVRDSGRVLLTLAILPAAVAARAAPSAEAERDDDAGAPSTFVRLARWVRARLRTQAAPPQEVDAWIIAALRDERARLVYCRVHDGTVELELELGAVPTDEALAALLSAALDRAAR